MLSAVCLWMVFSLSAVSLSAQDSTAFPLQAKHKFYFDVEWGYSTKGMIGGFNLNLLMKRWAIGVGIKGTDKKADTPDDYKSGMNFFGGKTSFNDASLMYQIHASRFFPINNKLVFELRGGPSFSRDLSYSFTKNSGPGWFGFGSNYDAVEHKQTGLGAFAEAKLLVPFKRAAFEVFLFDDINGNRNIAGVLIGFSVY